MFDLLALLLFVLKLALFLLSFAISVAGIFLVTIPFTGALVRLRANYDPKTVQLDVEGEGSSVRSTSLSYFGVLKRVWRLEGWRGLYKGIMPSIIGGHVTLLVNRLIPMDMRNPGQYGTTKTLLLLLVYIFLLILVDLPLTVITYRAMTTPHRLPFFGPFYSLRILFTPLERRRPLTVVRTPGLLVTQFLRIFCGVVGVSCLSLVLMLRYNLAPWTLVLLTAAALLSYAAACPLEVMSTKLAVQRNNAAVDLGSDAVAEELPPAYAECPAQEEDVINLRPENDPYLGFVDCARRIAQEEGLRAFYRGWWVTAAMGLVTGGGIAFLFWAGTILTKN